jgi:hypothetical protein
MADEDTKSERPFTGLFRVEHDEALAFLKQLKQDECVAADNPSEERIFADLAAAGFARKEGDAYVYIGSSESPRSDERTTRAAAADSPARDASSKPVLQGRLQSQLEIIVM